MKKENRILLIGCIISIIIIIILFIIRANKEEWLDINVQWLGLAILPLILALIIGKFIKKFSGFGVELELVTQEPLSSNTTIFEFITSVFPEEKDTFLHLQSLSPNKRRKANVLQFFLIKKDFYQSGTIANYIRDLPNVKYFEVTDSKGKFKSLSKIDRVLLLRESGNYLALRNFIKAIENNKLNNIELETTMESIYLTETAVEVYKKIITTGKSFIAIVDKENILKGVVLKTRLEKYFSELVINAADKK